MCAAVGGNRAILFMTDGEPSDSNRNDIINYINSKSSMNVKLLTFGFGSGLDSTAKNFLQQMASAGSGVFTHVPDSGDLRYVVVGNSVGVVLCVDAPPVVCHSTAMGSYYTHLSTPNPSQVGCCAPRCGVVCSHALRLALPCLALAHPSPLDVGSPPFGLRHTSMPRALA